MKAIVFTRYGPPDFLQLRELERPRPKDNELLIRVRATTVTAGDCEIRGFKVKAWIWLPLRLYMGFWRPKKAILGTELAGDIESVGGGVTHFREGNAVFGSSGFRFGANAQYICLPEGGGKPSGMSYEEAEAPSLLCRTRVTASEGTPVAMSLPHGGLGLSALVIAIAALFLGPIMAVMVRGPSGSTGPRGDTGLQGLPGSQGPPGVVNIYYFNGTFVGGPSNVSDRRTVIRFDFPAPCGSYLEARHTGQPNSIEFWVYVEAGNSHDLEGWGYHSWSEGTLTHREVIFTFDLGIATAPTGGTQTGGFQFYVSHPGLEWPSTTDWTLFCR